MRLYDRYHTYYILFGILLMHLLILGLCTFFCYRFVVVDFDGSVLFLLVFLVASLVVCDILLLRTKSIVRMLVRCKVSDVGIYCYGLFLKSWWVKWSDVCAYGTFTYRFGYEMNYLFFSTNPLEKGDSKMAGEISKNRVVFQVRQEIVDYIRPFLPSDIAKRLFEAGELKAGCFYRRKWDRGRSKTTEKVAKM